MIVRRVSAAAGVLVLAACSFGSPTTFSLDSASVDSSYTCPVGASNEHYVMHGTIDVHNGTSKVVSIASVDATLTLAAVKGGWLQKVGDKYDAGNITFAPSDVGAGSSAKLDVTIPSACTGRTANSPVASADYMVGFTMITSAGTFKVDSKDRHRISTG
ncbi:MAG TPA: hypothetical protein VK821_20565 [Dehalococcoidia bacterium]|nr:hypothetical protein [Dehalococcoidia bacterium]